ncbi:uncharacterized protein EV422DRAFT_546777 [Fimicolochytrium jonesii]|uniref:uncharacterized protein n=1 Tax=Fimicolochytrium jonesii TaxID=1396493 RepID=UPI0022FEB5BE|nr:uncharacterized protein EV422DRAFT_546777 [Fimicolochytrium jonesii]KAI8816256.1 hypothetical protein EV422DRAFT_546777 [Fimicolochytrium jonesii]
MTFRKNMFLPMRYIGQIRAEGGGPHNRQGGRIHVCQLIVFPIPWHTPVLHPQEVVDAIMDAMKKAQNSEIYLPLYTNAAPLFRFLPQELGDFIRWITGANNEMGKLKHRTQ